MERSFFQQKYSRGASGLDKVTKEVMGNTVLRGHTFSDKRKEFVKDVLAFSLKVVALIKAEETIQQLGEAAIEKISKFLPPSS